MNEIERERVVESLSAGYANGAIDVDELDRRLALVHVAKTKAELDALVGDIAPAAATTALVSAKDMRVLFGSIERTGPWAVPQQLRARVLFGNLQLDLREARLSPGVTTVIEVDVTMGNAEVIVPPGFVVDVEASSLLGSVEERTERAEGAAGSIVRITGRVRFGHLEVSTLRRGETRRDARRRRRSDRRWQRRRRRDMDRWLFD